MNKKQLNTMRRLRSVQEFLTTNQVAGTAAQLAVLSDILRQLGEMGVEQDESDRQTRGEVRRQRALRQALRARHLKPIWRFARRILGTPGLEVKFAMPEDGADNEAFIQAATAMAQAAEEHAPVFIEQGLPKDFVQQLRRATADLQAAVATRVQVRQRREKAGEVVAALVDRGAASVDMLDAIVSSRVDTPELLAAWKTAKRFKQLGGGVAALAAPEAPALKVA